jgi:hypothetical protein
MIHINDSEETITFFETFFKFAKKRDKIGNYVAKFHIFQYFVEFLSPLILLTLLTINL